MMICLSFMMRETHSECSKLTAKGENGVPLCDGKHSAQCPFGSNCIKSMGKHDLDDGHSRRYTSHDTKGTPYDSGLDG